MFGIFSRVLALLSHCFRAYSCWCFFSGAGSPALTVVWLLAPQDLACDDLDGLDSQSFKLQFQAMLVYFSRADPLRLRDTDVIVRVRGTVSFRFLAVCLLLRAPRFHSLCTRFPPRSSFQWTVLSLLFDRAAVVCHSHERLPLLDLRRAFASCSSASGAWRASSRTAVASARRWRASSWAA